jgi:hypothetical protein
MSNKNESAFPLYMPPSDGLREKVINGLTKREYFAAMAMQGLLSNGTINHGYSTYEGWAKEAIKAADELLNQLDKQQ